MMKLIFRIEDGPTQWKMFIALLAADLLIAVALMWALAEIITRGRA